MCEVMREQLLTVRPPQVLHPHYGMYVWPCAVVLAQYLWTHREALGGKAVLEVSDRSSCPTWPSLTPPSFYRCSAWRRCESAGRGGRQVRSEGDPVGRRRGLAVSGELQAEL